MTVKNPLDEDLTGNIIEQPIEDDPSWALGLTECPDGEVVNGGMFKFRVDDDFIRAMKLECAKMY